MEKEIQIPDGFEAKIEGSKVVFVPKENEDEKVRKALLRCCDDWEKGQFGCMAKEDIPAVRAWLEKQKTSEEAIRYLKENHSSEKVSDFQAAMNIAVARAYDKGVQDTLEKQKEQKPLMSDGEIEDKKRDIVAAIRKYYPADYATYLTSFLKGLSPEDNSEDEYGQEMLGIAYKLMYEHIPENLRTQEFWDSLKFMREYTGKVAIIHSYEHPAEWSEEETPDETKQEWDSVDIPGSIKTSRIETLKNLLSYFKWERKSTQEEIDTSFIPCLENLLKDAEKYGK